MIILATLQPGSFPGKWRILPALRQPRPLSRIWGMLLVPQGQGMLLVLLQRRPLSRIWGMLPALYQPSSWGDAPGCFFLYFPQICPTRRVEWWLPVTHRPPPFYLLLPLLQSSENSPLGNFLKGFIDVPSCHVGECPYLRIWGEFGGIGMSR